MITDTLKKLFIRDLTRLKNEIELYSDEKSLWVIEQRILNSGGNLCLHLIGNLNHYIGMGLAKTDYVRFRNLEFSSKNVPKDDLIRKVDETIDIVIKGLDSLRDSNLKADFPIRIWDQPTETEFTLVHLLSHLSYHLGQINYHRRLLDK